MVPYTTIQLLTFDEHSEVTYICQVTAGMLIFKEVKHGLHFTERSGVKGETVA